METHLLILTIVTVTSIGVNSWMAYMVAGEYPTPKTYQVRFGLYSFITLSITLFAGLFMGLMSGKIGLIRIQHPSTQARIH
jgi:hypothetical protein